MTIKKPVKVDPQAADVHFVPRIQEFLNAGTLRGKKQIITVGFSPELLSKIDAAAACDGISRAAMINLACSKAVAES